MKEYLRNVSEKLEEKAENTRLKVLIQGLKNQILDQVDCEKDTHRFVRVCRGKIFTIIWF